MLNNSLGCPLQGGRTLRSSLLLEDGRPQECARPVLRDVASSSLTAVATFSAGGQSLRSGKAAFRQLDELGKLFSDHSASLGGPRMLLVGKGTRCSVLTSLRHLRAGRAHCIEGPNVGARETHTIWSFCFDFYRHLPRIALFVQDDPQLQVLKRTLEQHAFSAAGWARTLEASFESRKVADPAVAATPWLPAGCGCVPVREPFGARSYGGYRPLHWWLASFLRPFANGSAAMPTALHWPAMAQFAMPRAAIRGRTRGWIELNVHLSELPAPLARNIPRLPGMSDDGHRRNAKWANFGPMVVHLGPAPRRAAAPKGGACLKARCATRYADSRAGINGMDFAQLSERSWFQAFDPALPEALPPHRECFEPAALALGPVRCAAAACPFTPPTPDGYSGGCAASDQAGRTSPPSEDWWPTLLREPRRRCQGGVAGCLVGPDDGSAAWARDPQRTV